ncbi:MAG: hypothetical protein GXY19_11860 [Phycisphaerae bacterium]|nr:hypothetical protein [Phycisphaerae bacterium]
MRGSTESRSLGAVLPVIFVVIAALASSGFAQSMDDCGWQDGSFHRMHWPQLPNLTATGSAVSLTGATVADDFLCTATGPIRGIHLWASFRSDDLPKEGADSLTIRLNLYAGVPAEGPKWGQPGELLWTRTFSPGRYTVQAVHNGPQDWHDPTTQAYTWADHRQTYQYDFSVQDDPFMQQEGNTYWLAVGVVESDTNCALGWKTTSRRWQWSDSAVCLTQSQWSWIPVGYPDGHEDADAPIGLAFVITGGDDTAPEYDLGDAPDSTGNFPAVKVPAYPCGVAGSFPTVYQAGSPPYGPLHRQPRDAFYLGTRVSLESEADLGPDEDGLNNLDPPSDASNRDGGDDGLGLPAVMPHLGQTTLTYTLTRTSHLARAIYVNVWCDWNRDGDWNDMILATDGTWIAEWVVQDHQPNVSELGTFTFTTPSFTCWHPIADNGDPIWVRITASEQSWQDAIAAPRVGGAGPAVGYQHGETEDYYLRPLHEPIAVQCDWGDAPTGYPTLSAHNGARHIAAGPWLGDEQDAPDTEDDGRPDTGALGDDNTGENDEDGVAIPPLIQGLDASITVQVNGGGGIVQGWIDFDADGIWQADEKVCDAFLPDGVHILCLDVPEDATVGQTFARFRISNSGDLDPQGPAATGEVEDHQVWIEAMPSNVKWCQQPDLTPQGIGLRVDGDQESPRALADDFRCTSRDRLTHIRLWGSWKNDQKGRIDLVRLRIHADDPAGPEGADRTNAFSKPRPEILWDKQFGPGAYQESLYHVTTLGSRWWWDPASGQAICDDHTQVWQLDFAIDPEEAFLQEGSEQAPCVYWLSVEVQTIGGQFGWTTRRWPDHSMDDAVSDLGSKLPRPWQELQYPKGHPYYDCRQNSVDLAFCLMYSAGGSGEPVTSRPATVTYCPAIETMCPATETKCPGTATRCPAVATQCPVTETQCPPMPTRCPAVATECPANITQCPTMETMCPSTETKCPIAITQCPASATKCPATATECQVFPTTCPAVETQCPVAVTSCPASVTQCPAAETRCPASATTCPVISTSCPASETMCPATLTHCPPTNTSCSAINVAAEDGAVRRPMTQTCPAVEAECLSVADYLATAR